MAHGERGLGRGLGALIPTSGRVAGGYREIAVSSIVPNTHQPRANFDEEPLDALADSIGRVGVLQPVLVRQIESDRFELIAASAGGGPPSVPAAGDSGPRPDGRGPGIARGGARRESPSRGPEPIGGGRRLPPAAAGLRAHPAGGGQPGRPEPGGGDQRNPPAAAAREVQELIARRRLSGGMVARSPASRTRPGR